MSGATPARDQFFTTTTDGNSKFNAPALGNWLRDNHHITPGTDDRLYRYRRGVYLPDGDIHARSTIREILGPAWRRSHSGEVVGWLEAHHPEITGTPPEQYINCTNGLLDWRTGELHDHTPDVHTTIQLPVPWDPDATCPTIDRFFEEALPPDSTEMIHQIIGLALYPANPLRKALLALGPSGTGKSKFLATVTALIGQANCSAVPLQVLAENRFAPAELFGKLANISGDLDARAITNTDIFKMATGGDPILAERKHGHPFSFTPYATFLFAANEAPFTSDQTDAWFERWVVVPFTNKPTSADTRLQEKLTTPSELAGLLVHAIAGLRSVTDTGTLTSSDAITAANAVYRDRLDSVRGFINDGALLDVEAWTPRPALYAAYRTWATESGRKALNRDSFYDHIRRNYPECVESTRRGIRGFSGLGLPEAEGAELPHF
jgi:putative DNA primase/helicase